MKNNYRIGIIILLITAKFAFSQNEFIRYKSIGSEVQFSGGVHKIDKNLLLNGKIFSPSVNPILYYLDEQLNTVWAKKYFFDTLAFTDYGFAYHTRLNSQFLFGIYIVDYNNQVGFGLLKADTIGNFLWAKRYVSADYAVLQHLIPTADSALFLIGNTNSFSGNSQDYDIFIMKTNYNGDTLWTRTLGGMQRDVPTAHTLSADGGIVFTGQGGNMTLSPNLGAANLLAMKLKSNGDTAWTREFTYNALPGLMNPKQQSVGYEIKATTDGGYIILGKHGGFAEIALLHKLDSLGNTQWAKLYYHPDSANQIMSCQKLIQTNDGGYMFGGMTNPFSQNYKSDMVLIKTDSSGNLAWSKLIGFDMQTAEDSIVEIMPKIFINENGYLLAGYFYNNVANATYSNYFIQTDSFGNTCEGFHADFFPLYDTPTILTASGGYMGYAPFGTDTTIAITSDILNFTDEYFCGTAIKENSNHTLSIMLYPNPSVSEIQIKGDISLPAQITIYNITGSKVFQNTISNTQNTINISALPAGIYIYEINTQEQPLHGKFVKE